MKSRVGSDDPCLTLLRPLPGASREPGLQRLVVGHAMVPGRYGDTFCEVPPFGEFSDQLRCIGGLDGRILVWLVVIA